MAQRRAQGFRIQHTAHRAWEFQPVSMLLGGSDPGCYNPFRGCPLSPEGLRGLIAALDRASALLRVPSFLRQHPDAPRAA